MEEAACRLLYKRAGKGVALHEGEFFHTVAVLERTHKTQKLSLPLGTDWRTEGWAWLGNHQSMSFCAVFIFLAICVNITSAFVCVCVSPLHI